MDSPAHSEVEGLDEDHLVALAREVVAKSDATGMAPVTAEFASRWLALRPESAALAASRVATNEMREQAALNAAQLAASRAETATYRRLYEEEQLRGAEEIAEIRRRSLSVQPEVERLTRALVESVNRSVPLLYPPHKRPCAYLDFDNRACDCSPLAGGKQRACDDIEAAAEALSDLLDSQRTKPS